MQVAKSVIRLWVHLGLAVTATAQAPAGRSQSTSPDPPGGSKVGAESGQKTDEIIVVANPVERTSIDRTTYIVRDNAVARASNALDVLARVPTVDVTPAGQVRLLGRSGVRIQVDGNDVANATAILQNLQGSQVAKIEVISNPSAQFSAQGTAGIINIVTRRSFANGLGGSLTASAGSFGAYELKASPTLTRGLVTLSGSIGRSRTVSRAYFQRERRASIPDGVEAIRNERGSLRNRNDTLVGNVFVTYRPSKKETLSLTAIAAETRGRSSRRSEILFPNAAVGPIEQPSDGDTRFNIRDMSLTYRRDGRRDGESLTVSAKNSSVKQDSETEFATLTPSAEPDFFGLRSDSSIGLTSLSLDYVLPYSETRRLSFGGLVQRTNNVLSFEEVEGASTGGRTSSRASTIRGAWFEKAAYATYQFGLLGGTILAGLRAEDRRYDLAGSRSQAGGTHLFPTLHLERTLGRNLTAAASYSRRIEWPGIIDLDPVLRFSDPVTAIAGNRSLRPELTDSFEAKVKGSHARQNIELTVFVRQTDSLRTIMTELVDGVQISRPVNLGRRLSQGANFSIRGPLVKRLRYSLAANLARQNISDDRFDLILHPARVQVSGSAQLEYRDGVEGRRDADHFDLRFRFTGPSDTGLYRTSSYVSANATWSHAFTDQFSGVLTISDLIGAPSIRIRYLGSGLESVQVDRSTGPRVTLGLTYSLSPPPAR